MKYATLPLLTAEELKNRDFKMPADRWFHIAPIGEFMHYTGFRQVIDQKACESMVNRFNDEAKDPHFPGLLVDFDHFSNDTDKPSTAAGWITKLENRADGLWAQIRWSDLGQEAVVGGRFRLVSPVWNRKESQDLGNKSFRPMRLDRVALTNDPVLKGMTPLTNRADDVEAEIDDEDVPRAATRDEVDAIRNAGTSEGARKGWETRRAGMAGKAGKPKVGSRKKVGSPKPPAKEIDNRPIEQKREAAREEKEEAKRQARIARRKALDAGKTPAPNKVVIDRKMTPDQVHLLHLGEHSSVPQYKADLDAARKNVGAQPPPLPPKDGYVAKISLPPRVPATPPPLPRSSSSGDGPQVHIHIGAGANPFAHGFLNRRERFANRRRPTTTFDGERIPLAAQKRRSTRNAA